MVALAQQAAIKYAMRSPMAAPSPLLLDSLTSLPEGQHQVGRREATREEAANWVKLLLSGTPTSAVFAASTRAA